MKKVVAISLFVILALILCDTQTFAQPKKVPPIPTPTAIIKGRVTDADTGEGIAQAKVVAQSWWWKYTGKWRYETYTDAQGNYEIRNVRTLRAGIYYRLSASKTGYHSKDDIIFVMPGRTYTVDFALIPVRPPVVLKITSPQDGAVIKEATLNVEVYYRICGWQRYQGFDEWHKIGKGGPHLWWFRRTIDLKLDGKVVGSFHIPFWQREGTHTFTVSNYSPGGHELQSFLYLDYWKKILLAKSNIVHFKYISDVTPPSINNLIPPDNSIINIPKPEISAIVKDIESGVDPSSIKMTLDGQAVAHFYNSTTGKMSYTPSTALAEGLHKVDLAVKDFIGNEANKNWSFTVDTVVPLISDLSPPDGSLLNNGQPEISAILNDATSGIDSTTIIMNVDGQGVTPSYDSGTGKVSYIPVEPLLDALHTVVLGLKDKASNLASVTWSFTTDITPPVINNLIPEPESTVIEDKPIISASFSDNLSGIDTSLVLIKVDDQDVTAKATVTDTKVEYTPEEALENGEHTIVVEVKDLASNLASISWVFTVQVGPQIVFEISSDEPVDLAVDQERNFYILESALHRVVVYDRDGIYLAQIAVDATNPKGIALDSAKNIYIADTGGNRIMKLKKPSPDYFNYVLDDTFGTGGFVGTQGSEDEQFNQPWGIGVDTEGNVYVTDSGNNRIQKFNSQGQFMDKWGEGGIEERQFTKPKGIDINVNDNISIADSGNNRIQRFSPYSAFLGSFGKTGAGEGEFTAPLDVTTDLYYYVVDTGNNRLQKFYASGTTMEGEDLTGKFISQIDKLDLDNPSAVAIDEDLKKELIYIADTGNNRVIKVEIPIITPERSWNDMKATLISGDIEFALTYFDNGSKERYRETFNILREYLPEIVNNMAEIELIWIKGNLAKCRIPRIVNGVEFTHYIYFLRDDNGEWKIRSF